MKRILGDAKSQMDQKYVGAFFGPFSQFSHQAKIIPCRTPRMIHS